MAMTTAGVKPSPPRSTPESTNTGLVKWVYGGGGAAENLKKGSNEHGEYEVIRRIREAERAEKIMHLICWGPTK